MTVNSNPDPDQRHRATTLVGFALMMGVVMYACVAWWLVDVQHVEFGDPARFARMLTWVGVVTVFLLGAGLTIARRAEELDPNAADPDKLVERYYAQRLVGLAVEEGAGLLVVTISLLAAQGTWALAGGLASVAVMAVSGPRKEHVERLSRR